MNKTEQIRLILYQAADALAELLAEPDADARAPDKLLNTVQLAEYAGLSQTTITKLIREMEAEDIGGVIREGRAIRVSRNKFTDFLENRKGKRKWRKAY